MFTLSVVLFLSCVRLSVGFWPNEKEIPECGPNEVLNHCVGCPSEDFCYDDIICTREVFFGCNPGCLCKEGFIRKTLDRECIPKEECGAPCEVFEQYTECRERLNETCASIVSPSKSNSEELCTPGCGCLDGYYRADEESPCQYHCSCPELRDTPECVAWNAPFLALYSS